jgi:hypothetical protein
MSDTARNAEEAQRIADDRGQYESRFETDADALALGQLRATLALVDVLQKIAEALAGVRTFGAGKVR